VELPESKSDTSSAMRGRIGVVIGLLLAATVLYIALFALLHRHEPDVETVFGVTGSEPGALAAMIFSIPALRGLMPGAPPFGVDADVLVLVWVQLAVILGLTLFVITWVSRH
jgi:hypothetical protein